MKRIQKNDLKSNPRGSATDFVQDSNHWTRHVKPATDEGKEIIATPYNSTTFCGNDPEMQELSAISLKEFYEHLQEKTFAVCVGELTGLYHLIKHNPHFQPEACALLAMVEGETIMNQFIHKVDNL